MLKTRLSSEIATLLCAKLLALCVLYLLFFAPTARPRADAGTVAAHMLNP